MKMELWVVPVLAQGRRSLELIALEYKNSSLHLTLAEEDSGRAWRVQFSNIQAFKSVSWECGAHLLSNAPDGAFFEVTQSPLLEELGLGRHEFLNKSHHFVVSTYDDIVHVIAWSCEFSPIDATSSGSG